MDKSLEKYLQKQIDYLIEKSFMSNSDDLWSSRIQRDLKKYLNNNNRINKDVILNFRKNPIFIHETPSGWGNSYFPFNWIIGSRRGQLKLLKDRLDIIKDNYNDLKYLNKYPINKVGNPLYVTNEGFQYNRRWINNLRYLSLINLYLDETLNHKNQNLIDIGGGYGIFINLLKNEYPNLKLSILEFPEQLILNYFYIKSNFPEALINTLEDVYTVEEIDTKFINKYDFILIPIECLYKIKKGAFNIVTNFFSMGEMSEEWFNKYLDSNLFKGLTHLFMINRFESRPTYNTNLNVLSYRLNEYKKIHFQIN